MPTTNGSGLPAGPSPLCEACHAADRLTDATLTCRECKLDLCLPCATADHRLGPLTRHTFHLIMPPPPSSSPDPQPSHPDSLSRSSSTPTLLGPHPPSSSPMRPPIVPPRPLLTFIPPRNPLPTQPASAHTPRSRDSRASSVPASPLTPSPRKCSTADDPPSPFTSDPSLRPRATSHIGPIIQPRGQSLSERRRASEVTPLGPLSAVAPSRRLLAGGGTQVLDGPSSSTFKLSDYSLSTVSTPLRSTGPPLFTLTVDPRLQTLCVVSTDGSIHHTRAFTSLLMVTHSMETPTLFTVHFSDSKPVARCMSTSPSEAALLCSLLSSFIDQVRTQAPGSPSPLPLLYHGRIQKKSQLRWKPVYIALRPFQLQLYRGAKLSDDDLHRSVNLQGCVVRFAGGSDGTSDRGFVLEQREGKVTLFRGATSAERDTLVALVQKAMDRKAWGDDDLPSEADVNGHSLRVNTGDSRSVGLSVLSPLSQGSLPTTPIVGGAESTPLSPQPGSSPFSATTSLISPSFSSTLTLRGPVVNVSRRRSRRSMSKEFAQLLQRERAPPLASPPSASGNGAGALGEFVELPRDPRPAAEVSPVLGRGVYTLMSALLSSFIAGAALTATLYVPKGVWQQVGRKVQAYAIKVDCWETLHEQLLALPHPPLSALTAEATKDADDAFLALHLVLEQIHERLAQHLPYLPSPQPSRARRPPLKSPFNTQALTRLLSRATDAASIGARKLDEVENARYCEAARGVLEGVAVMRQWHEWVERWRGVGGEGVGGLEGQMAAVDEWLYTVFVSVLLHDLQVGVARYMKHAFRGLKGTRTAGEGKWTRAGANAVASITAAANGTIT